jgi:hypothetical protein
MRGTLAPLPLRLHNKVFCLRTSSAIIFCSVTTWGHVAYPYKTKGESMLNCVCMYTVRLRTKYMLLRILFLASFPVRIKKKIIIIDDQVGSMAAVRILARLWTRKRLPSLWLSSWSSPLSTQISRPSALDFYQRGHMRGLVYRHVIVTGDNCMIALWFYMRYSHMRQNLYWGWMWSWTFIFKFSSINDARTWTLIVALQHTGNDEAVNLSGGPAFIWRTRLGTVLGMNGNL